MFFLTTHNQNPRSQKMEKFLLLGVTIHWLVSGFKKINCRSSKNNKFIISKYLQITMIFKDYILTPMIFMTLVYFSFNPLELKYLTVSPNTWRWNIIIIFIIISILLKIWAYKALGNSWSDKLRVDEKLKLVTTGPYKYFRHPIYISYVIFLIPVILSGNIFLPLPFLIFTLCNSLREKEEERLLKKQFPEYIQRMKAKVTSAGVIVLMIIIATFLTIIHDIFELFQHFL